jgi:hypothetical protein
MVLTSGQFAQSAYFIRISLVLQEKTPGDRLTPGNKKPASVKRRARGYENNSGGVPLSPCRVRSARHLLVTQAFQLCADVLSSALPGLTSEFGMGPGVAIVYLKKV